MKSLTRHLGICAAFITFLSIQSASALKYDFWWLGWENGGVLTGSMEIDETIHALPEFPDVCFADAVTSFNAHWSGDPYSQPYDWAGSGNLDVNFIWSVKTHQILDMDVGGTTAYPTFISIHTFIDYRTPTGDQYFTTTTQPILGQVVPDAGSTALFLGLALTSLIPLRSLLCHARAETKSTL